MLLIMVPQLQYLSSYVSYDCRNNIYKVDKVLTQSAILYLQQKGYRNAINYGTLKYSL